MSFRLELQSANAVQSGAEGQVAPARGGYGVLLTAAGEFDWGGHVVKRVGRGGGWVYCSCGLRCHVDRGRGRGVGQCVVVAVVALVALTGS